jgi:hypothetical protein
MFILHQYFAFVGDHQQQAPLEDELFFTGSSAPNALHQISVSITYKISTSLPGSGKDDLPLFLQFLYPAFYGF